MHLLESLALLHTCKLHATVKMKTFYQIPQTFTKLKTLFISGRGKKLIGTWHLETECKCNKKQTMTIGPRERTAYTLDLNLFLIWRLLPSYAEYVLRQCKIKDKENIRNTLTLNCAIGSFWLLASLHQSHRYRSPMTCYFTQPWSCSGGIFWVNTILRHTTLSAISCL